LSAQEEKNDHAQHQRNDWDAAGGGRRARARGRRMQQRLQLAGFERAKTIRLITGVKSDPFYITMTCAAQTEAKARGSRSPPTARRSGRVGTEAAHRLRGRGQARRVADLAGRHAPR